MKNLIITLYGVTCYVLFLLVFLAFPMFLLNVLLPVTVSSAPRNGVLLSICINVGLIALFGVVHSVMARDQFKRWWTQFIPPAAERSTFVLQASLLLGLVFWGWQPLPTTLWFVESSFGRIAIYTLFIIGVATVLASTFLIDHFELFGLRQIFQNQRGRPMPTPIFKTPSLYRIVRHPMQLGIVMMLFATPHMTVGHLLFASAMTAYILIGLHFEERVLLRQFGEAYRRYQQTTPMLIPVFGRKPKQPQHAK